MSNNDKSSDDHPTRSFSGSKRFGGNESSHGKANLFNVNTSSTAVTSPQSGASTAFGLGSGAFASFGATKTPKSPGNALESSNTTVAVSSPSASNEKRDRDYAREGTTTKLKPKSSASSLSTVVPHSGSEHPLKYTWVVWYRPPTSKYSDYEKSTIALVSFSTVEAFWSVYSHLKRPSSLPSVSDYHIFKKGIRPVWEDQENRRGGKFIVRLKKGVADRYWEDLLLAIAGDQFAEAGEEVCGAVLSVRGGEDVLSVWTRIDGGRNIKIR
jgi:translation initiation factor 4E